MRFFIDLAYDGQNYHGWQWQPNALSVQEVLEDCLKNLFRRKISLTAAGRTDTGVHARSMMAHFDLDEMPDLDHTVYRLNRMLPPEIAIHKIYPVRENAHARFDAIWREYRYYVSVKKDVFAKDFSLLLWGTDLDVDAMNQGCEIIKKHRDFESFSKIHTDVKTFICTIKEAKWELVDSTLVFTIVGDRFLRGMVRTVVGTLLDVGKGKLKVEDIEQILNSKDRSNAGDAMAAKGLFMHKIIYPKDIFL